MRDVGPRARRWLKVHPPAAVTIALTLPANAYFQTGIVLDPAMWAAPLGDGVRFIATITPAGGPETTLFDLPNHPRAQGEHRRWIDVVADLRPVGRPAGAAHAADGWPAGPGQRLGRVGRAGDRAARPADRRPPAPKQRPYPGGHLSALTAHELSCNSE